MGAAFATGALAAAFVGAALATLVLWVVSIVLRSGDPWAVAPLVVGVVSIVVGVATYAAERLVHRRSMERKRATGEPWAYRGR